MKRQSRQAGAFFSFAFIVCLLFLSCTPAFAASGGTGENLPDFQLTYDAEEFYAETDGGVYFLRPVSLPTDRGSLLADNPDLTEADISELTQAREKENQIRAQCGITVQYLPGTSSVTATASCRESCLDTWLLVTETEPVEGLGGIGFHTTQGAQDMNFEMRDWVFLNSLGGCFQLTVRYWFSQPSLSQELWNIVGTFRASDIANTVSGTLPRLGQARNAVAQGSTWQEAYRAILCSPQDYLTDMDYQRSSQLAWGSEDSYVYLGIYDFDADGVPELIYGDGLSAAVFGYAEGKARKLGELCDTESPWCINGLFFHSGVLHAECAGSGCSKHIYFAYLDGEYKLGIYSDMSALRITINGEAVSRETLESTFPMDETSCLPRIRRSRSENTWYLETEDGTAMALDEDFNFSLFAWA